MPKRVYKRKTRKCKGIVTSEDPRERPLVRCGETRDRGDYCEAHASQAERQDQLRRYLKIGWANAMVAARGRPTEPEVQLPSVEDAEQALVPPEPEPEDADEEEIDLFDSDARRDFLRGKR